MFSPATTRAWVALPNSWPRGRLWGNSCEVLREAPGGPRPGARRSGVNPSRCRHPPPQRHLQTGIQPLYRRPARVSSARQCSRAGCRRAMARTTPPKMRTLAGKRFFQRVLCPYTNYAFRQCNRLGRRCRPLHGTAGPVILTVIGGPYRSRPGSAAFQISFANTSPVIVFPQKGKP